MMVALVLYFNSAKNGDFIPHKYKNAKIRIKITIEPCMIFWYTIRIVSLIKFYP